MEEKGESKNVCELGGRPLTLFANDSECSFAEDFQARDNDCEGG